MIVVDESLNIFNDDDLSFLEEICRNFEATESPKSFDGDDTSINFFYRYFIPLDDIRAKNIAKRSQEYTNKTLNQNNLIIDGLWVNRVDIDSNKDDVFHKDNTITSMITYLNDDYEGGEFEYVDIDTKKKIKIKPKKNLSIWMNDRLAHRVLPVTSGIRYSLVSFYRYDFKKNKTLI